MQEFSKQMKEGGEESLTSISLAISILAVLVAMVRSRAEVEEIAVRLEHSLDDDYAVERYVLHGSASVGFALYPEDAATRDGLLSAADAAMYVAKHTRQHAPTPLDGPTLTPEKRS